MMDSQTLRQQLVSAIVDLPQETLVEILLFVDYQRYKSARRAGTVPNQQPLVNPEMNVEPISTSQPEAPPEIPLYKQLSPKELAQAFGVWVNSHDLNTPGLSDYAVSRESMYEDEVY